MKKRYIYFGLVILVCSMNINSCEDFLDVSPKSQYSVKQSYKTQKDFEQAIAGIYAEQQNLFRTNSGWFRAIIGRSDETQTGQPYLGNIDEFIGGARADVLNDAWESYWRIIYLSNTILGKIDEGNFQSEELQKNIKGEAHMLRAYAYWSLAWQFGGMPLIKKPLNQNEIKKIKRTSQKVTFNFAIEDYKKAIDLLPEGWQAGNEGRVTKYAAEGMLARLYMFQSKFSAAKPYLSDIINSGKYHEEKKYVNCFTDSHDNGPEWLWQVQFTGGQTGEGQFFSTGTIPEGFAGPDSVMPFTGFSSAMIVSNNFYNSYEKGDIRKDVSILKGYVNKSGVKDTTDIYFKKWTHFDAYTPKGQSDWANNLPILRYTDIKMSYAEVLNEEGYVAEGEAFDILNQVRARAHLDPYTSAQLPSENAFRKALRKERRREFAFEGLRWMDLVRWGIAQKVMNNFFSRPEEGNGQYSMKDYQTIFAIPFEVLSSYNDKSVMEQNPGY